VKISEAIDDLSRVLEEYGDQDLKIADTYEAAWRYDVDRLEFEPEHDSVTAVSDR
jgi:hypothetical protein